MATNLTKDYVLLNGAAYVGSAMSGINQLPVPDGWTRYGNNWGQSKLKMAGFKLTLTPVILCVAFMSASIASATAQSKICTDIHKRLIQRQQGHEPADFFVEPIYEEGGGTNYPNLDIDGDKVNDSVIRSCGAGVDSLCSLLINLSTGEQIELEEKHFFLARVKSLIYVIVGETSEKEKDKRGKRRIYQITKQAIKLICLHI